jgi:VanZ family protein
MSASPILFSPNYATRPQTKSLGWFPVLCTLVFICCTSTAFMGCQTSQAVVNAIWKVLFGTWHWDILGEVNGVLRKTGHFVGYGLVSLVFRNAWYRSAKAFAWVMRHWLTPFAASLAIVSTFIVAGLDELHQHFIPGRIGSLRDALLDTAGALFLNLLVWALRARRRRNLLNDAEAQSEAA